MADTKTPPMRQALRCARLLREGWHDKSTLARRLGVTERTIKRYLAAIALEDDGYETRRVDEIGRREYRVRHRIARDRGAASNYEIMALAIAERFFRAFDPGGVADLLDQVLLDLTGEEDMDGDDDELEDAGKARRAIARRFVLARAPQPLSGRVRLVFDRVLRGLVELRVLTLRYQKRSGETKDYTVRPYTLVLGDSELALTGAVGDPVAGHADTAIRTFALHRIEEITLETVRFKMPPLGRWNPQRVYADAWGLYAGESESVEVRIHPGYAPLLADRTWHPSQEVGEPGPDGWLPMRFDVFPGGEFRTWLLGWGPWLRVTHPPDLAAWVQQMRRPLESGAVPGEEDLFRIV